MTFFAKAPSNIALVKYMGKEDSKKNVAANPSISMTLNDLCSIASATWVKGDKPSWSPESPVQSERFSVPDLSPAGRERILEHVSRSLALIPSALNAFGLASKHPTGMAIQLRVANAFPAGAGIASSASSFAAVTLAVARALAADTLDSFDQAWNTQPDLKASLARISKLGSGSSGRSMLGPWVEWDGDSIKALPSKLEPTADFVLVVDSKAKSVSSSAAHSRVLGSPLWAGRPERALSRAYVVREALAGGHWAELCRQSWQEAWEMHSLFHTASPPFTYWKPATLSILAALDPLVQSSSPPLVTLDAGPNVHVLVPLSQSSEWKKRLELLAPEATILADAQGTGADPYVP